MDDANISYGGMSGGAILNSRGTLIGINTGAENELYFDEAGNYEEYSLGFSIGESITNVLGYLQVNESNLKEDWLSVSQNTTPELSREEVVTIITQLLTTEKPTDETDLVGWMNYGNQQWRYRSYDEAVNAFNKAIAIAPDFDKAYYAIGLVNYRQGDYGKAATALLKATEIDPNPYFYWRWLGSAYGKLQQYDEAIAAYDRALENNQNETTKDFVLYLERGNILREKQSTLSGIVQSKGDLYQKAEASYNEAVKINPLHPGVYNNRGLLYKEAKEYDLAIADFSKAIEINPNYGDAYYNRSEIYSELEQYKLGNADKVKALKLQIGDLIATINSSAIDRENLEKYQQAVSSYSNAIAANPNDAEAYYNRGNVYQESKQYQLAINDYNEAIAINSNHIQAYYNRGATYSELKQYEPAIADYGKAISLNPNYVKAYENRGDAYQGLEQYEQAVNDYNKAISLNPNSIGAYTGLGNAYRKLKQYDRARTSYQKARQLYSIQNNPVGVKAVDMLLEILEIQAQ